MFKSKTVFVIGAGASAEIGLPVGDGLAVQIGRLVNLKYDSSGRRISGSCEIENTLSQYAEEEKDITLNDYRRAGHDIAKAVALSRSIDEFIDAHQADKAIERCAKLGIVEAIHLAEQHSKLYVKSGRPEEDHFNGMMHTWYMPFFRALAADVPKRDIGKLFKNVTLIIFNYDRCIEYFLTIAISLYYRMNLEEAKNIVDTLTIIHPYGTVGNLFFSTQQAHDVDYGGRPLMGLKPIAANIRTYTQTDNDKSVLNKIHYQILEAEKVIYLGFAFHSMNMELITLEKPGPLKRVFATVKGWSAENQVVVRDRILSSLLVGDINCEFLDGTCYDLFNYHSLGLSS